MSELRGRNQKPQDYLRDGHQFQTYPSMNPVLRDMAAINGNFITENRYILLLTVEEAQEITDELLGGLDNFFSYKLGPGNIKDGLDGFRSLSKLTTYTNPVGQLIFSFKSLKIKAIEYKYNGKSYIKITGYAGMRRILNGTRYGATNPQMLEMAIGMRGVANSIVKGTKFCIYFSLAWRVVELIFKSDYDLVDFLVDITMDVAKIIVSSVVIGVASGMSILMSASLVVTILVVLVIGVIVNIGLNSLDNEQGLSAELKDTLRRIMVENQHVREWNNQRTSSFFNLLSNTSD